MCVLMNEGVSEEKENEFEKDRKKYEGERNRKTVIVNAHFNFRFPSTVFVLFKQVNVIYLRAQKLHLFIYLFISQRPSGLISYTLFVLFINIQLTI